MNDTKIYSKHPLRKSFQQLGNLGPGLVIIGISVPLLQGLQWWKHLPLRLCADLKGFVTNRSRNLQLGHWGFMCFFAIVFLLVESEVFGIPEVF